MKTNPVLALPIQRRTQPPSRPSSVETKKKIKKIWIRLKAGL